MAHTIAEESIPPDKAAPRGTSLRKCNLTLSKNKFLSVDVASSKEIEGLTLIDGNHQFVRVTENDSFRETSKKWAGGT
jgi:hypothetical protein